MNGYMPPAKTDDWATPRWLFNHWNDYYKFGLDAAASSTNHLCSKWFGLDHPDPIRRNGLTVKWDASEVWVNPPYGRGLKEWVKKAWDHKMDGGLTVMLLPARTDTQWFHEYCYQGDVRFIKGRLKYGDGKSPAPFPSMIVIL